jgi:hypothetical protein
MKRRGAVIALVGLAALLTGVFLFSARRSDAASSDVGVPRHLVTVTPEPDRIYNNFEVQVLVNGRPLEEYVARGRSYVEAIEGAEYEVRIRNPLPVRIAVALSVDGLNTINARHTTAWQASKWVIGPYQTIHITGWQVSSERARHFYFTTESDSYGAKLGQTANLGLISAVFFREQRPVPVTVAPPPRRERPSERRSQAGRDDAKAPTAGAAKEKDSARAYPEADDESAATGIGRSVSNDVRWVDLELDSHPAAEVTIRYEFYQGLVKLGIQPRHDRRPEVLRRREDARGFEDRRFSPEP